MLNNIMKKTIALALAAVTFGLPLMSNDALAAPHDDKKPAHKVERRVEHKAPQAHKVDKQDHYKHNDKRQGPKHQIHKQAPKHKNDKEVIVIHDNHNEHRPVHHPAPPPHKDHHSSNDKLVTGLVIGAVIGAVIANAN